MENVCLVSVTHVKLLSLLMVLNSGWMLLSKSVCCSYLEYTVTGKLVWLKSECY